MAMNMTQLIEEDMMVHAQGTGAMNGAPGIHVGTVDKVEGQHIKLTRNDSPDGRHHLIPIEWVDRVEGKTVFLSKDADTVRSQWQTAD